MNIQHLYHSTTGVDSTACWSFARISWLINRRANESEGDESATAGTRARRRESGELQSLSVDALDHQGSQRQHSEVRRAVLSMAVVGVRAQQVGCRTNECEE